MAESPHRPDEDAALRTILEGTAREIGRQFFTALTEHLARALGMHAALVTEYLPETGRARALGFFAGGAPVDEYEYDVTGTPCGVVLRGAQYVHCATDAQAQFPTDADLRRLDVVSYMGVPLHDVDGRVLGHLAVMDTEPMAEEPRHLALFHLFGRLAAAELQRQRAEAEARRQAQKLGGLVESVGAGILELDAELRVTLANAAAARLLGREPEHVLGAGLDGLLAAGEIERLRSLRAQLDERSEGDRGRRVPGGLTVAPAGGDPVRVEATFARVELERALVYALVLHEVGAHATSARAIETAAADHLGDDPYVTGDGEIVGRSTALRAVLDDLREVAPTDATVLILGETGTGKELIARAVHEGSTRGRGPFVRVNCAAIAPTLIESELFGHEQGAFTGATRKREGRFTLAHGGTIFLDEIGELPLDLQAKLLRVLQEGELERVGSSVTRRVDVRVVAATNRALEAAVGRGEFREDLYYRLNVFPIRLPPLREREDDVVLLANAFAARIAKRLGRRVRALDEAAARRLRAHAWPGNVRELQNVVERAVITARDGWLNLERALPVASVVARAAAPAAADAERIRTVHELAELERANIVRALESAGWKVSGEGGAARLLDVHPSTLSSRMKALGIRRPG